MPQPHKNFRGFGRVSELSANSLIFPKALKFPLQEPIYQPSQVWSKGVMVPLNRCLHSAAARDATSVWPQGSPVERNGSYRAITYA